MADILADANALLLVEDVSDGRLGNGPGRRRDDARLRRGRGTEETAVRDDAHHGQQDVDAVIDEVADPEVEADRRLLPPEGRPQRIALDAALAAKGVHVTAGALATGWELTLRLVELGAGLAVVNASVRIPRGLVARPLAELPRIRYVALTRRRPRADAAALVAALVAHGDAWQKP